jgi:hypothetical protein
VQAVDVHGRDRHERARPGQLVPEVARRARRELLEQRLRGAVLVHREVRAAPVRVVDVAQALRGRIELARARRERGRGVLAPAQVAHHRVAGQARAEHAHAHLAREALLAVLYHELERVQEGLLRDGRERAELAPLRAHLLARDLKRLDARVCVDDVRCARCDHALVLDHEVAHALAGVEVWRGAAVEQALVAREQRAAGHPARGHDVPL